MNHASHLCDCMWTELGVQVLRGGSPGIPVFLPHQNQLTADYILLWCYVLLLRGYLQEIRTNSDRHEFVCFMRLHKTSLKFSYRSHVNHSKSQNGSRDFKPVISSQNQAPSIFSRFHVNSCKHFIPVQVHTGLSSSRSHVNTL